MALSAQARRKLEIALANVYDGTEVADALNAISLLSSTEAGYLDGVTAGTAAASKAVVLGADSTIDVIDVTTLKIGGTEWSQASSVGVTSDVATTTWLTAQLAALQSSLQTGGFVAS